MSTSLAQFRGRSSDASSRIDDRIAHSSAVSATFGSRCRLLACGFGLWSGRRFAATLWCISVGLVAATFPVAAQSSTPAYSLNINVSSLSADGGSVTLQPQYSAFIGSELSSLISAEAFYPGYFGQGGLPTQKFLDAIVVVGAPAGMRVTAATVDNPFQNVHGVGPGNGHRTVHVTISGTDAPLTGNVAARLTVKRELLTYLDPDDGEMYSEHQSSVRSEWIDISAPLTITPGTVSHPLEFDGIPVQLSEDGAAGGYRTALKNDPGNGNTVTVSVTSSDPGAATVSPGTLTFTGGNMGSWQTPRRVTVTPVTDEDGSDESLFAYHAISGLGSTTQGGAVGVTVTDDDGAGVVVSRRYHTFYRNQGRGTRSDYTLRLGTPPSAPVTIALSSSDSSRVSIATGSSVTINPNDWNQPQTVSLSLGSTSGFAGNPVTITHAVTSTDSDYNGVDVPSVLVQYRNVGANADPIEFSNPRFSIAESGSGQYTLELRRDPGNGRTVTVNTSVATAGNFAQEVPGAMVSPQTFTFTGGSSGTWSTAQTVTVTPIPDGNSDNETVTVSHAITGWPGNTRGGDVTVIVTDDLAGGGLVFDPPLVKVEQGLPARYSVRLKTKPVARRWVVDPLGSYYEERYTEVDVRISSQNLNVVRPHPVGQFPGLEFNTNNWNVPQWVSIEHGGTDDTTTLFHTTSVNYDEPINGEYVTLVDESYRNLSIGLTAQAQPTTTVSTQPRATLSVSPTTVAEGGSLRVRVSLEGGTAPTSAKIIPLLYTNGSAADADYTAVGTARILANQRSATVTVAVADDSLFENDETFTIALGEMPFGIRPPGSAQTSSVDITISANDKPEIGIAADTAEINEGNTAGFTITASNASQSDIDVGLTVSRTGTYVAVGDTGGKSITLPAGQTTLDYDITTDELASDDPSGSVRIALGASSNYSVDSAAASGQVAIRDTDATTVTLASGAGNIAEATGETPITVTLGRGLVAGEALSLPLTVGGTAVRDTDYTIAEPATLPAGVTYDAGNATPTITFTGPNSGESASSATLTLTAVQDAFDEGAGETVSFTLPALNASSGTGLDGGVSGSGSATVTIDDDDAEPEVSIQGPSSALTEGDSAAFTISVDGSAAQDLTIGFSVSQTGTFVNASAIGNKTLSITSGTSSATHTVTTVADSNDEPSGSLTVTLTDGTGYRIASGAGSATVALTDDDATGVTLAGSGSAISETSGSKTVSVSIDRGLVNGETLRLPLTLGGTATLGTDYSLSAPSPIPTGVTYANLGSTDPVNSPPTIVFTGPTSGATAASTTLILRATPDNRDEGTSESVTIALPNLNTNSGTGLDAGASGSGSVSFNINDDDDEPVISLTRQGGSGAITEGEQVTYSISANRPSDSDLTITLNLNDHGDFLAAADQGQKELVLEAGETSLTYIMTTTSDVTDEPSARVGPTLVTGTGYTNHGTQNAALVTVNDDDATLVTLAVPSGNISETGGTKTLTLTLPRALEGNESLPVPLGFAGNAAFGTDYALAEPNSRPAGVSYSNLASSNPATSPPTVTFSGQSGGGATSATVILQATSDALVETNESLSVGLGSLDASTGSNLHGGARGTGSGSFAITDGTGAPEIRVTAGAATVEGMAAQFTVRSSATSTRSLRVNLSAAQSGSFVAGAELGAGKSVVIPAGETSATYSVPTLSDGVDEANGAVTLTVASGTGYSVSSSAGSASVTVTDDDSTTVTLASSDTTATEGSTTETGAFTVTLGRALVSGESLQVPLTARGETEYTLALAGATGIALSNNRDLTFTGGAGAERTATVTYRADVDSDDRNETVRFSIPGSTSGSPRMTATGLGGGVVGSGSALVVVTDTGESGRGRVNVQPASLTIAEGGSRTYRMVLTTDPGSGAEVVITPASDNPDVTFSPDSLSFTGGAAGNWSTWQRVTVAAAEDADTAVDSVTLSHTISGYAGVTSVPNVSVSVTEAGAGFLVSPARVDVVAGQSVDYTIRLASQPAANVVLDLTSGDTSVATVPSSVTIPPANWQSGVAVTVTGVAAGTASISHAHATTTDSGYATATLPGNVDVNVFAAAPPEITVESNANANGVTEGADASFQINASPAPASDLVVSFTVEENGNFATSGAELPTSATILAGRPGIPVLIETTQDTTDEPDGSFVLTLQPGADYSLGGASSVTVPVTDNDPTTVELSTGSTRIAETGGGQTFIVRLGRSLVAGESVSAPLSLGGTASLGTDYRLHPLAGSSGIRYEGLATASPTVVFTGGPISTTLATVTIRAVSDLVDDDNETVIVTLGTPTSTGLGGGASSAGATPATFRIVDDDGDTQPTVSIAPDSGVTEGTPASFTVSVSPALAADANNLTVNLNVGQMGDYVASGDRGMKQVTINAGSGMATYNVPTAPDSQDEAAGSVTVNVDPGSGYQVSGSSASASVAVADNDNTDVTLSAAAGNISEASGAKEIKLTLGRALVSGETLTQRLTFGGTATFGADYTLAAPSPLPSGVSFSNLGSSNLSASPPTVVFTGGTGASRVATLTLTATQDTTVEAAGETITVSRGTTAQTGLGGVAGGGSVASFRIVDDDSAAAVPELSITAGSGVTEGGNAAFTIDSTQAAPSSGLRVTYTLSQQGEFVASAAVGSGKSATIPAGQSSVIHTIATTADSIDEAKGSLTVSLASGTGYTVSTSAGVASLEVEDNDPTGVTLSASSSAIPETGGVKRVTLTLDRALVSGEVLAVPINVSGAVTAGDYSLGQPASPPAGVTYALSGNAPRITFNGSNGAPRRATFTLSATSDLADEGEAESVTIGLGSPSPSGTGLAGGASGSGSATFDITDDDGTPVIRIEGGNRVAEGSNAVFMLKASPAPQQALTINLNVADDSVADFVASGNQGSQTVQIPAHATTKTYEVATVNDSNDEPRGEVTVTVANGTGYTPAQSAASDTVQVSDNDRTTVTLSLPDTTATESSTSDTATIRLALPRALVSGESVSAALNFSGGRIGRDFSLSQPSSIPSGVAYDLAASPPTVTFTGGAGASSAATVLVSALADTDETDGSVSVRLGTILPTGLDGGVAGTGSGTIQLTDAGAQPAVDVDMDSLSVNEGATVSYRVKLHTNPGGTVTVTPQSGDSTRLTVPGALSFNTGNWSNWQPVNLTSLADADLTDDDVTVTHTVSGYGSVTTAPSVTVSIIDGGAGVTVNPTALSVNEGANGSYTVRLNSRPSASVTITPTSGDTVTATVGNAVTFAPAEWSSQKSIQVSGVNGGQARISHSVSSTDTAYAAVTPSPVDVTVTGTARVRVSALTVIAVEHGAAGTYDVWLNTDPGAAVTVTPQTTSSAIGLSAALSFNSSNFRVPQRVTVTANTDTNTTSESATITHAVSGYSGVNQGPEVAVTVQDAGSRILVSPTSLTVKEGDSTSYTLTTTTEPTSNVTLTPTGLGGHVTVSPSPATFGPGRSLTQQVTVQGVAAGSVTLNHRIAASNPNSSFWRVTVPPVSVRVTPADAVIVSPINLAASEGGTATYYVELASDPGGAVTVTPASSDTGAATVSGALSFNSSNWDAPRSVTVTAVQDGDGNHENVTISHQVSGYTGVSSAPSVTLFVGDDEFRTTASVQAGTGGNRTEGQAVTFDFSAPDITSDVTLHYNVSATGGYVASGDLGAKTLTVPAGGATPGAARISVATLADSIDEPAGTVTVTLTNHADYTVSATAGSATRTVDDNDRGSATLAAPAGNIAEDGGSKTLTLTLNRALVAGESVALKLAFGGKASLGTDFTLAAPSAAPSGVSYALEGATPTVTFTGSSAASATVILNAEDDSRHEGTGESVSVSLSEIQTADISGLGGGMSVSGSRAFTILDDDKLGLPQASITPSSNNTVAEGGFANFTIKMNRAPAKRIFVEVTLSDAPDSDFLSATLEVPYDLTIQAGSTTGTLPILTNGDSVDEPSGAIRARITGGGDSAGYDPGTPNVAEVTIIDNDRSSVTLETPDASAMEGDSSDTASISLTLNRGLASGESLKVPLRFSGGVPGTDFTLACPSPLPTGVACADLGNANAAVTFTGPAAGVTATSVTLTLTVSDDADADHERVTVSIPTSTSANPGLTASGLDGGVRGARTGSGQIALIDDDTPPPPNVSLSVNNSGAVTEGGTLTVTAEVSEAPSGQSISIPVQRLAASSTAEAGDYTLAANITIASGATTGTATLTARSDNDDELTETLRIELGSPPEGYINSTDSGIEISITDDTATDVTLTTPDTNAAEADANDTAEIRITLGRGLEGSESLIVPLQFSGGTLGTDFNLALSGTPAGVTFDSATGELTFAGPTTSATVASVLLTAAVDDNAGDDIVTVSIPTSSATGTPRLTATNLDGGATGRRTGNGRITLKDAGLNVRTIGWAATSMTTTETAAAGTVNVALSSADTAALTFRVCLADGTAALGSDYQGVITAADRCTGSGGNADFTIAAGDTTELVSFKSVVDTVDEPDETYSATITLPTPVAGLGISPATIDVTIRDDDPTLVSLARTGSGAINEGGKVEFTVTLGRALVTGETIDVPLPIGGTGVNTGDWSLAKKAGANTGISLLDTNTATPTVRFSGAGAQTATLELASIADGTGEGSGETYSIALGSNTQFDNDADTDVGGGADPHGTNNRFTVLVNDPRSIGWSATALSINETDGGQTTGSVNASLSTGNGPVTFRVCLADGSASRGASADYRGFGAGSNAACTGSGGSNADLEIASGQSNKAVTFTVNGDTTDEPDETFTATLSLPSAVTGLSLDTSKTTVTATIVDDDPTVVSLARVGSGAIYEAGKAEFTVTLGRALVAGEIIDVPLSTGGTNITTGDWSLAKKAGAGNTGVSLSNVTGRNPNVRFSGAGARVATLELTATVDGTTEGGGETLTLALGPDGSGANGFDRSTLATNVGGGADPHGTNNSFNLTINDGRTIGWQTTAVTVNESSNAVNLRAELSEGTGPVSFRVCLAGESATFGDDFTGVVRSTSRCTGSGGSNADPSIGSGASSKQVSPGIDQSVLDEPRETFTATLSLPSTIAGLSLDSAQVTATVTIVDKDPTLVTLSAPTGSISENGGTKTLTLKLGRPLVSPEVLTVPLNFGGVANRNSEYTVACASAGGVQCNNLNSGNASVTFTGSTGGANASATATLTITGIEDNVEEGSESVTVSLGTLDANSGTNLDGGASGSGLSSGSVDFNLSEIPTITFERDNYEVTEGGTLDVVLVLSQELEGWVIGVFDYEYESAGRRDTQFDSEIFSWFEPGETRLSVSVPIAQDDHYERDETFRLEVRYAREYPTRGGSNVRTNIHGTKLHGPPPATTTITIRDDEEAQAGVTVRPVSLPVTEGGQPQDYRLVLNRAPAANVTVIATSQNERRAQVHSGQDAPARQTTLTFTPGNWNEPQPVSVTAMQDADTHDHVVRIDHEVRGTGEYANVTAEQMVVVITDDDTEVQPLISIYPDSGRAITEGSTARFRVIATPAPSGSIDVNVTVAESGDFADSGQTGARTVTIGNGGRTGFLHVTTDNDSDDEANGAITATVDPGNGYDPDAVFDSASITVQDNDDATRPEASFAASSSSAGEGAGTRNIQVDFDPVLTTGITLRYDVSGNATGGGNDYSISGAGSLQVSAGASSASIPVSIIDDSTDEPNETVRLTLTSGSGYQLGAQTVHTLTITDNDDPPPATPVVSISGGGTITEGGTATFNLSATPAPQSQITVNVDVVDSGSFAGSGQSGSRQVTIGTGGSGTLTVTTDNDSTDEPDGSLTATIASGQGYSPSSSNGSASVAVNDDDLPPPTPAVSISGGGAITEGGTATFTLSASPAPQGSISVTVNVTQSGNFARGGQTGTRRITIGGSGTATFSVTTNNDSTDEPNGSISAAVRSGTGYTVHSQSGSYSVTVNDDDEPLPQISISRDAASVGEGQAASFTLSANPTPTADLVVHLDISQRGDFAADGATGAKTVTFPANTATATHTVATVDDDSDERDGTVTARVVSRSHYRVASTNEASVSVTDDDVPVPEIRVTSEQATRPAFRDGIDFEGATLKFTLHADVAPEADLEVTVQVDEPGNAFVNSADAGTRQVTIPARQRQATLSVRTIDDSIVEDPSSATVTTTVQSGTGYTVAAAPRNEAESIIHDNDGLPTLSISDGSAEEGDEVYFQVTLSKPVAHEVSFTYSTESGTLDGQDYGSASQSEDYPFTSNNATIYPGSERFEIWIPTFDDAHDEGDETFTVILYYPENATIDDGEGTGTIENSDPLPDAWLARFGRAAAEQALDGITARIDAVRGPARETGFRGMLAGRPIGPELSRNAAGCAAPDEPSPGQAAAETGVAPGVGATGAKPASSAADASADADAPGVPCGTGGIAPLPWPSAFDSGASRRWPGSGTGGGIGAGLGYASPEGGGMGLGHGGSPTRRGASDLALQRLLTGSSFAYTRRADAQDGVLGFWGRGSHSTFNGAEASLRLGGNLTTGMLGTDYARGNWLLGMAITQTIGDGGYSSPDSGSGDVRSTLTAAVPYAAWKPSERWDLWGAAGYGSGRMTLSHASPVRGFEASAAFVPGAFGRSPFGTASRSVSSDERLHADMGWSMAALGLSRSLGTNADAGPELSLKSDALWSRTTSGETRGMMAGAADVTRLRLGLAGRWMLKFGTAGMTPELEVGVRHDGGDAETGFGVEVGGGIGWLHPASGLSVDLEGRTLLAHEAANRRDFGFSASLSFDPSPESRGGPVFRVRQDMGGQATGGLDALFSTNPLAERMGQEAMSRWTAEAAWGFPAFRDRFVSAPTLGYGLSPMGRDYSLGWQLQPFETTDRELSFKVKFTRREISLAPPAHGIGAELRMRW